MKVVDWFARKMGYTKAPTTRKRSYAASLSDRFTLGWVTMSTSADREIRDSLETMVARSRQLARDNDYAKRFLSLCDVNIVGPTGIRVQNKAKLKSDSSKLDKKVNTFVEERWARWGRVGNCTADGTLSWRDAQSLFVRTLATDGEVLVRKVRRPGSPFLLQFLECDQLDIRKNEVLPGGNEIRMGVELNPFGRPVAYHILTTHPGDLPAWTTASRRETERIPASEIIHEFVKERPSQTRGVPWMHSAMLRLKMLGGYEEAELIAARVSACKMGVIETPTGDEYGGDAGTEAGTGAKLTSAEPGIFDELAAGQKLSMFDPTHPSGNYDPFVKACLRGIASGINVSYHSLTGDLTQVNFSSIRSGTLEMRDMWRTLQSWTVDHFCQRVFEEFLQWELMLSDIGASEFDRVNKPLWQGRSWEWVDPEKDINASILAINNKLSTRTAELQRTLGLDFEEVLEQLALEEQMIADAGLTVPTAAPTGKSNENGNEEDQVAAAAA